MRWREVRGQVEQLNPELFAIIDAIDPPYPLFEAVYPFGWYMMKNGKLFLPVNQQTLPIDHPEVPSRLKELLSYNLESNPISLILENSAEIFFEMEDRTIPLYGLIKPGYIFGVWRALNPLFSHCPAFLWDMTAGARSLIMLPKISESSGHDRLKKAFQLKEEKPRSLLQHWKVFREIANHESFNYEWNTKILYFTKDWFTHLQDKAWQDFAIYLYTKAWQGSEFWRNQFTWDLIYSVIAKQLGFKPNPYIVDTVKCLINMAIGALPGFTVATDDVAGPISQLQTVYKEVYRLKHYPPLILCPALFSVKGNSAVYYSLQYPNTIEFAPSSRERYSLKAELYDIRSLLTKYLEDLDIDTLNLKGSLISLLKDNADFIFFHSDDELYEGMRSTSEIPNLDETIRTLLTSGDYVFPTKSKFFRGCIGIFPKNSE